MFCSLAETSALFLAGRFLQGLGAGCCYVVAFAILRDTLDDRRRAKVLSLLNGITCIIPVLAPVLGHLIMLKFPAESVLDDGNDGHRGTDVVFVYFKETRPAAPQLRTNHEKIASHCLIGFPQPCCYHHPQRFGDPHLRQHVAGIADGNHGF